MCVVLLLPPRPMAPAKKTLRSRRARKTRALRRGKKPLSARVGRKAINHFQGSRKIEFVSDTRKRGAAFCKRREGLTKKVCTPALPCTPASLHFCHM